MVYNMMTCQGPGWSSAVLGDCSLAWGSFGIIIFLALILRRQCEDGVLAGTGFNIFGAMGLGIVAHVLLTTFVGSARWSLLAGIIGLIVGGFVLGLFFDSGGGDDSYG